MHFADHRLNDESNKLTQQKGQRLPSYTPSRLRQGLLRVLSQNYYETPKHVTTVAAVHQGHIEHV